MSRKTKIFNVISLITTIISAIGFLFCIYLLVGFFIEHNKPIDPDATVSIEGDKIILILYLIFGGISAGVSLISLILSLVGIKSKKGKIYTIINSSFLGLEIVFFVLMFIIA